MAKDFSTLENSNPSDNPDIHQHLAAADPGRRVLVQGGLGAWAAALLAPLAACAADPGRSPSAGPAGAASERPVRPADGQPRLGFQPVPPGRGDAVAVPDAYLAHSIAAWGEPVGLPGNMPDFRPDAGNSAAEQAAQMGMHHDGMHYLPLAGSSRHGLLVMNHEYTDDGLLHTDGMAGWSAEKVAKAQAAHGISVIEVKMDAQGRWQPVLPSRWARRVTARTPHRLAGPAAGHRLVCTAADPDGRTVLGTLNNCASGLTPWGTYLSGEENFAFYFDGGEERDAHQRRWGLPRQSWTRWSEHDARFDARRHPNEFNRFGWVVELDPMDPQSTPVKRTALGRAAHEGAWVAVTRDQRAVVYSGEDARFEYIYKFVSRDRIAPAGKGLSAAQANRDLLDHGTLYVARFDADGSGRWLPLVFGQGPLTPANGFADQGEVLVKARQASDLLGATKMDRPEWLAIDPLRREVFCSLTNNSARGAPGQPGVDAANPRANNVMGQVIRWQEAGDFDGQTMQWRHLLLAGDPANARPDAQGNVKGDAFACPDGLYFDQRGVLWLQTDAHSSQMNQGELAGIGNNQLLACDPTTGEVRRFLTGPVNAEITGVCLTPDGRTLFVNVQHPGESPSDRSDPAAPDRFSTWPDKRPGARPRSATVVVRRRDGGLIGT